MLTIRQFDPHAATPDAWAAFHAYRRTRAGEDDPDEPVLSDAEIEHDIRHHWPLWRSVRFFAHDGDAIVGSAGIGMRREGAPDHAEFAPYASVWGGVLRDRRRQGIATALLRPVLAYLRRHGKATVTIQAHLPDGHAFLRAAGAIQKQRRAQNRLDLAGLNWATLAAWEATAPPSLRWEIHHGPVPTDRLAELLPAFTALMQDEPRDEMDGPPPRFSMEGYAAWYEEAARVGAQDLLVLLLDGGAVAGLCSCTWDPRTPGRIYQNLTAVARPWRGRGVAKAVKARVLHLMRDAQPGATLMLTNNATSNAAMLSINTRLGFVRHREDGTYQASPDALDAWLLTRTPPRGA